MSKRPMIVIPACLRRSGYARAGESRNPVFHAAQAPALRVGGLTNWKDFVFCSYAMRYALCAMRFSL